MKFGVCIGGDSDRIAVCKSLGYDYVESAFSLLADENEEPYERFRLKLAEQNIPCWSVNCFLPSSLKVTGPDVDIPALSAYVDRGMRRGAQLGVKKIVFGSSGARNLPEGFPYEKGIKQIFSFLQGIASPIAEKYGLLVVIEPLSPKDTNVIQSVREGAIIAAAVNRENVRLLADLYHVCQSGDTYEHIRSMKGLLKHAHIAEPVNRIYPAPEDGCDYQGFINALAEAGCDTCSIEGRSTDFDKDAAAAIRVLKGI